jgi:hypothetical protein
MLFPNYVHPMVYFEDEHVTKRRTKFARQNKRAMLEELVYLANTQNTPISVC